MCSCVNTSYGNGTLCRLVAGCFCFLVFPLLTFVSSVMRVCVCMHIRAYACTCKLCAPFAQAARATIQNEQQHAHAHIRESQRHLRGSTPKFDLRHVCMHACMYVCMYIVRGRGSHMRTQKCEDTHTPHITLHTYLQPLRAHLHSIESWMCVC